jgi:AcrR family transcriptional regulator
VIAEAIALADADGLVALSMPKLARRLGVGTMTLYGYVAGKDDLLDRMAASMLESIRPGDAGSWSDRAHHYFRSLRRAALEHPAFAALLTAGRIEAGSLGDALEALMVAARDEMDESEAARALLAALALTTGTISREMAAPIDTSAGVPRPGVAGAAPDRRWVTAMIAAADRSMARDEQFEWGLDAVLGDA